MILMSRNLSNYQVSITRKGSEFGKVALTVVYQLSIIKHKYESLVFPGQGSQFVGMERIV